MDLVMVGLNYKTASIDLRESIAFKRDEIIDTIKKRDMSTIYEEFILSTCNRTEFYGYVSDEKGFLDSIIKSIKNYKGVDISIKDKSFYVYRGRDLVSHLFEVSSGIDSMIVGENQILGQLKDAYKLSIIGNGNGKIFNKLLHKTFETGKIVRTNTDISKGNVSISGAAVELLQDMYGNLNDCSVLLLGLGEIGTLIADNLIKRSIKNLYISNRTIDKSINLAKKMRKTIKPEVIPFDKIPEFLGKIDVVLSSTGAKDYIFTVDSIKHHIENRRNELIIIDLSLPRTFDPEIKNIKMIKLFCLDDLKEIGERNRKKRMKEVLKANLIIDKAVDQFFEWYSFIGTASVLRMLQEKFENIRKHEVEKSKNKFNYETLESVESITKSIIKKILKYPLMQLKQINHDSINDSYALELIKYLFSLDKKNKK